MSKENYYIKSVERAFTILESFSSEDLSIMELEKITNLNKATVRRFVLTLVDLGYLVRTTDNKFKISPLSLKLGENYLNTLNFRDLASPILNDISTKLHESSNLAILDGSEALYVSRFKGAERILSANLHVGARLPFYATSLGKALVAWLPEKQLKDLWDKTTFEKFTENTIIDYQEFLAHINEFKLKGYMYTKNELEFGLQSIAAPIFDSNNNVIAALNISAQTPRVDTDTLENVYVPELLNAADTLNKQIAFYNL